MVSLCNTVLSYTWRKMIIGWRSVRVVNNKRVFHILNSNSIKAEIECAVSNRTGNVPVHRNIEASACNHCCSGEATNITYSQCMFLTFDVQHATRTHRIILLSVACPVLVYFFHIVI